jgi:hypothetical protein
MQPKQKIMTGSSLIHRIFIFTLAGWMLLCCCDKKLLASAIADEPGSARACCQDTCCKQSPSSDDSRPADQGQREAPARRCTDGCCNKICCVSAPFEVDVDTIGTLPLFAMLPKIGVDSVAAAVEVARSRFNRSDGEPPPRLVLILSARIRI